MCTTGEAGDVRWAQLRLGPTFPHVPLAAVACEWRHSQSSTAQPLNQTLTLLARHHSGLHTRYRQAVELLFRNRTLQVSRQMLHGVG